MKAAVFFLLAMMSPQLNAAPLSCQIPDEFGGAVAATSEENADPEREFQKALGEPSKHSYLISREDKGLRIRFLYALQRWTFQDTYSLVQIPGPDDLTEYVLRLLPFEDGTPDAYCFVWNGDRRPDILVVSELRLHLLECEGTETCDRDLAQLNEILQKRLMSGVPDEDIVAIGLRVSQTALPLEGVFIRVTSPAKQRQIMETLATEPNFTLRKDQLIYKLRTSPARMIEIPILFEIGERVGPIP